MSNGAKAGIGIGVALAVLILLVVGGLFLWKRHRRNRAAQTATELKNDNLAESGGAPTYELSPNAIKYEAYGVPVSYTHLTLPTKRIV